MAVRRPGQWKQRVRPGRSRPLARALEEHVPVTTRRLQQLHPPESAPVETGDGADIEIAATSPNRWEGHVQLDDGRTASFLAHRDGQQVHVWIAGESYVFTPPTPAARARRRSPALLFPRGLPSPRSCLWPQSLAQEPPCSRSEHAGVACIFVESGERVHLTLTSNPSHLEAVNPVVVGRARAKQVRAGDSEGETILPLLLHGDAAFAGQGIVAETLNLSQLPGYSTGGTLHIIINNQIGFTTTPAEARSSLYCSDIAKMIQVPIFHVNGDDPEAAVYCVKLAMEYRQRFQDDVVIDLVCYRRHG
ncbi:MAG: hypothetical protein COA56_08470, partial [Dehalococcoidia bacterium]